MCSLQWKLPAHEIWGLFCTDKRLPCESGLSPQIAPGASTPPPASRDPPLWPSWLFSMPLQLDVVLQNEQLIESPFKFHGVALPLSVWSLRSYPHCIPGIPEMFDLEWRGHLTLGHMLPDKEARRGNVVYWIAARRLTLKFHFEIFTRAKNCGSDPEEHGVPWRLLSMGSAASCLYLGDKGARHLDLLKSRVFKRLVIIQIRRLFYLEHGVQ